MQPSHIPETSSVLTNSREQLTKLLNTPPKNIEAVMSCLREVCKQLWDANNDGKFNIIIDAILISLQAFEHFNTDPILTEWTNWKSRVEWIDLELKRAELGASERLPDNENSRLGNLKTFYIFHDGNGLPLNYLELRKKAEHLEEASATRCAHYNSTYHVANALSSWPRVDYGSLSYHLTVSLNNEDGCSETKIGFSERIRALKDIKDKQSFENALWKIYGDIFMSITSRFATYQYLELFDKKQEDVATIMKNLRVHIFSPGALPEECILDQIDNITNKNREISQDFHYMSSQEIVDQLKQPGNNLVLLTYGNKVVIFALVIKKDEHFLPRTVEKLEQLNELEFVRAAQHSWLYYICSSIEATLALREFRVDWYRIMAQVLTDIGLSDSIDQILGINKLANPAAKSNQRAGFEPISTQLFPTDNSAPGVIVGLSTLKTIVKTDRQGW